LATVRRGYCRPTLIRFANAAEQVAPIRVFSDGTTAWKPYEGVDFTPANLAITQYLRAFHLGEYAAACDPSAYQPAELTNLNSNGGLVLTRDCGELWVPLLDDIAQWIEDGRPTP